MEITRDRGLLGITTGQPDLNYNSNGSKIDIIVGVEVVLGANIQQP